MEGGSCGDEPNPTSTTTEPPCSMQTRIQFRVTGLIDKTERTERRDKTKREGQRGRYEEAGQGRSKVEGDGATPSPFLPSSTLNCN